MATTEKAKSKKGHNRGWPWKIQPTQETWSIWLSFGLVLLGLGIFVIYTAFKSPLFTLQLIGTLLLLTGLVQVIRFATSGSKPEKNRDLVPALILGILFGVVGLVFLFFPGTATMILTSILGILLIIMAVIRIFTTLQTGTGHQSWLIINALITISLGIMLLLQWPLQDRLALAVFLGTQLIIDGLTSSLLAIWVRKEQPVSVGG